MITKENILELVSKMISNSPKERYTDLKMFMLETQEFTKEDIETALLPLKDKYEVQKEIGKKYGNQCAKKTLVKKPVSKKEMNTPILSRDFKGFGECQVCKKHVGSQKNEPNPNPVSVTAFFQVLDGKWLLWHASETCLPTDPTLYNDMKKKLKVFLTKKEVSNG